MSNWYTYILKCSDETFYTGITTNLKKRLEEHNHDNKKGAKYTRARRPVVLVYSEESDDRSQATKRELAIKKLSRNKKQALIDNYSAS